MVKVEFRIPLKDKQELKLVPIGDVHFDTDECDRERLTRFVKWVGEQEKAGYIVRLLGLGDYLDFASPSERAHLAQKLHETTAAKLDRMHFNDLWDLYRTIKPLTGRFLGLLTGHHNHGFTTGEWAGRTSDEWLSAQLKAKYFGDGLAFLRLKFPHDLHLIVGAHHGGGSAQTYGARVMKRFRMAEITPGAHLFITGHDNAKFAYSRSGLDFECGAVKRYAIASGAFQRAYLEGPRAGYAERMGLIPADLGVSVITIKTEKRDGRWRVDYHVSV